jgi:site-specific recombinase XerD
MDDPLLFSFELHLRSQNVAANTIKAYVGDTRRFDRWRAEQRPGCPDLTSVSSDEVKAFLAFKVAGSDDITPAAPASVARMFRSLQQFYRWLDDEGEIALSPMAKMKPPHVPEQMVPIIPEADLQALLKVFGRKPKAALELRTTFEDRRDHAMILMMLTAGVRSEGITGMSLTDVDLRGGSFTVTEKGRRTRTVGLLVETPYGSPSEALDRYLRARSKHKRAALPALWLGRQGAFTYWGLEQMLKRRCEQAGVPSINPHRFRHTFGHIAKANGMTDENLKSIGGWKTQQMVERYGRSAADERARAAHRDLFKGS